MEEITRLRSLYLQYQQENPLYQEPGGLFEPADYIMQLGGKRLRPVLLLLAYNLFEEEVEPALPLAYAVEIFHNFTLVHDDIMDKAPLRRGQPTVHHKYDINTGILSGDVMLILAYQYLLKIKKPHLVKNLVNIFSQVAIDVCKGQQFDMDFETQTQVSIDKYLKMIELKTAVLIGGAMKLGAVLAEAGPQNSHQLYEFGKNLGIAFQLQDDLLDTFGNPETFGKKVGGDIVQNKKTWLVLKTLELANESTRKQLLELLNTFPENEEAKISTVKSIFNHYNIQKLAEEEKAVFYKKAFQHLANIPSENRAKKSLIELAENLLNRKE